MSHFLDYLCKPASQKGEDDFTSFMDFEEEMNNLEIPLNLESQELMSSDFFDSVFSMERENYSHDVENSFLKVSSETSLSEGSTHLDDVDIASPITVSTDSDSFFLNSDNTIYQNDQEFISTNNCISFDEQKVAEDQMLRSLATKFVVHHPNMKRVIVSKPAINSNGKKIQKNKQVIRVQPISSNGRSLLVPINVKNVKKIKIINANELKMDNFKMNTPTSECTTFIKRTQIDKCSVSSSESVDDENECENDSNNRYPPLNLTPEEKRLLIKEGIQLPSHYPLTKNEEKELKRIRRKIRNKISAQDSRKRKKEYVDKLEEKAKRTSEENEVLKKRIKLLRKQNSRLMEQMRKLQTVLFNTTATKASPTTCLMIVLFSTLLICLPNLRITEDKGELGEQQLFAARRALLFNQKEAVTNEEEGVNMEEFLVFNKEDEMELENFDEESENSTDNEFTNFLNELAQKYGNLSDDKNFTKEIGYKKEDLEEFCRKYGDEIKNVINSMKEFFVDEGGKRRNFIEPDISDNEGDETFCLKWKHSTSHFSSIKEEPPSNQMKVIINNADK